jgi:O-antigen/teichoic acid export membrane protein
VRAIVTTPAGRLRSSLTAGAYAQAANLLVHLLSIPVLLSAWGAAVWGEWLLLAVIPAAASALLAGLGPSAGVDMTLRVTHGDHRGAAEVFHASWVATIVMAGAVLGMVAVLAWSTPLIGSMNVTRIPEAQAAAVVTILLAHAFVQQLIDVLHAAYRSSEAYGTGLALAATIRLAEFATGSAVVLTGAGPIGFACAMLVGSGVGAWWMRRRVFARAEWLRESDGIFRFGAIRPLLWPSITFKSFPIGHALSLQGVLTVIGTVMGPSAVAAFSLMRTITRVINQVADSVAGAYAVELSKTLATDDRAATGALRRQALVLALGASLLLSLLLGWAGDWIVARFSRSAIDYDAGLFALLLAVVVTGAVWRAAASAFHAVNRHHGVALSYVTGQAAAVALAVPLTARYGLHGTAVSLLLAELALTAYMLLAAPVGAPSRPCARPAAASQ